MFKFDFTLFSIEKIPSKEHRIEFRLFPVASVGNEFECKNIKLISYDFWLYLLELDFLLLSFDIEVIFQNIQQLFVKVLLQLNLK